MDELAAAGMKEPFVLPHDPSWKGLPFEEIYEKLIASGMVKFVDSGEGDGLGGKMPGNGRWIPGRQSQNLKRNGHEGFDGRCESSGEDEQVSDAEMRRRARRARCRRIFRRSSTGWSSRS